MWHYRPVLNVIMIGMAAEYVTTAVAAKTFGLGKTTLNSWVRQGIVRPAYTTAGGQHRWLLDDLRQQLENLGNKK